MTPTTTSRRRFTQGAAALLALPGLARADDSRPLEWVVGYAAGGGSDTVARIVAEAMAKSLQKDDPELTYAEAVTKAARENRDLYAQHTREQ